MAVTYLKKAEKTPQTGTDETRRIVETMLAKIESEGESAAITYGRELDGYEGDIVVPADVIAAAGDKISQQLKDDIRFSYDRVTAFAEAQKQSIQEFETELSPGLWAGQKLIPIETAGCYVPGGAMRMWRRPSCRLQQRALPVSRILLPVLPRAVLTVQIRPFSMRWTSAVQIPFLPLAGYRGLQK